MDLEKRILREKSKDRKVGAKDLGRAFLSDLPDKRKQKYLNNPLRLITHLDILFLFHTSVSKRGQKGEFEDPIYYGLLPSTFYKMLEELQKVGALNCIDKHYEFRKGKSRAGFDYSKSKGCKRKYEVCEGTPYFKKINPGSARWKALRELNKNCYLNTSKDLEDRIKYPEKCIAGLPTKKEVEYSITEKIQKIDLPKQPLTSFGIAKTDVGEWQLPSWGQDLSDATFVYNKELLQALCLELLLKTEKGLKKNLKKYVKELNESLVFRIKQNPAYQGFKRKIEPNCSVKTSRSTTVSLKTSWRASTAFSFCPKQDREKMKVVFGWNASFDISSEAVQICSILGNNLLRISNRSFYKKLLKILNWEHDPEMLKKYKTKEKILAAVKQSVVRMMSIDSLHKIKQTLCYTKNPILPSVKYVDELYNLLIQTVGFFDSYNLFYYTSFVEILAIHKLRSKGIFVENCYDEFYYNSTEVSAKEIRDTLTESCLILKEILK